MPLHAPPPWSIESVSAHALSVTPDCETAALHVAASELARLAQHAARLEHAESWSLELHANAANEAEIDSVRMTLWMVRMVGPLPGGAP
jgi:hypothetical protein